MNFINSLKDIYKDRRLLVTILFFCFTLYSTIKPYGIYIVVIFSFYILSLPTKNKYITKTLLFLLCFSVLYFFMLYVNGKVNSGFNHISYLICPILFYVLGEWTFDKTKTPYTLDNILLLLFFSFSLILYISTISNIFKIGFVNPLRIIPLPNNEQGLASTLYALNTCFGLIGLSVYLNKKKTDIQSILFLLLFILSTIVNIHVVNRTSLVVSILLLMIYFVYAFRNKTNKISILLSFGVILLLLTLIMYSYTNSFNEVLAAYENRQEQDTAGIRFKMWTYAINHIFIEPFGFEYNNTEIQHMHNLWFDVARLTGIAPFTFLLIATIRSIHSSYRIYKYDYNCHFLVIVMSNATFIMSSMVEPVMEGFPVLFYIGCFIWGLQDRLLGSNKV